MKLAVVIPVHCHPDILRLTLFSLVKHLSPNHELTIHLGVHSNFDNYCSDFGIFNDPRIKKLVSGIHLVDEIDWQAYSKDIYRYSRMHAKNVINLFHQIRYYEFDYVLVLDNDVLTKADFVTETMKMAAMAKFGTQGGEEFSVDLIGSYFEDTPNPKEFTNARDGETLCALPKISAWHLLLSRKLYEMILENPTAIVSPREVRDIQEMEKYSEVYPSIPRGMPIFIDTFCDLPFRIREKKMGYLLLPREKFAEWAQHFFCSSFNYGEWSLGMERKVEHIAEIVAVYKKEFPQVETGETECDRCIIEFAKRNGLNPSAMRIEEGRK